MPYNIQFQLAGLLLVCLTGLLLLGKKAVRLFTQKNYIILFVTVAVSICLDIVSVIFIVEQETLGTGITHAVCKAYLLSIVAVALSLWQYAVSEVHKGIFQKKIFRILAFLPLVFHALVLMFTPIQSYHSGMQVYTYGVCVTLTYCFAIIYLATSLIYTIIYRAGMSRSARNSIWFLIGAWLLAAMIQMMHNEFLIVSFAMGIAMVYMYIKMENPETFIDNESSALNAYAYTEYLQKAMGSGRKFWVASVHIEGIHFVNESFGFYQGRELLQQIVDFLRQTGDRRTLVFRTNTGTFSVFYTDEKKLRTAVNKIEARFEETWQVEGLAFGLECRVAYLADSSLVESPNELIDILHYFTEDVIQKEGM